MSHPRYSDKKKTSFFYKKKELSFLVSITMTSQSTKWTPKKRDYVAEHKQLNKSTTTTSTHPLGIAVIVRIRHFTIVNELVVLEILDQQDANNKFNTSCVVNFGN